MSRGPIILTPPSHLLVSGTLTGRAETIWAPVRFVVSAAVDRAMRAFHETNPARFHAQRPAAARCPYDELCRHHERTVRDVTKGRR